MFFLILVAIMPFALGPDLRLLARLGPAILWIAALLATLLGLDRLFQADHEDGSLDLLINGALPLEVVGAGQMRRALDGERLPLIVVSAAVRPDAGDEPRRSASLRRRCWPARRR